MRKEVFLVPYGNGPGQQEHSQGNLLEVLPTRQAVRKPGFRDQQQQRGEEKDQKNVY